MSMDAPTISIKLKGLAAIQALGGNGPALGAMKVTGVPLLLGLKEVETNLMGNGMMMRDLEIEGKRMLLISPQDGGGAAQRVVQAKKAMVINQGPVTMSAPSTASAAPSLGVTAKSAASGPVAATISKGAAGSSSIAGATKAAAAKAAGATATPMVTEALGSLGKTALVKGGAAAAAGAAATTVTATTMAATTGAGVGAAGVAAKAVVAPALGWGLVLGSLGPWLAVGSLGLAATGIYFYVQAKRIVEDVPELDGNSPLR